MKNCLFHKKCDRTLRLLTHLKWFMIPVMWCRPSPFNITNPRFCLSSSMCCWLRVDRVSDTRHMRGTQRQGDAHRLPALWTHYFKKKSEIHGTVPPRFSLKLFCTRKKEEKCERCQRDWPLPCVLSSLTASAVRSVTVGHPSLCSFPSAPPLTLS